MIKNLIDKLKEASFSILPITLIVILLHLFNIVTLTKLELIYLIFGALLLIISMTLFTLGSDISMTPMGRHVGESLVKTKKINLIIFCALFLGILITVAEPDLSVLAEQVPINSYLLIFCVAFGVGIFLVLSMLRIIFKLELRTLLIIFYGIIFTVVIFVKKEFLPLAFDSGGVTTGPITVPFIMALGVGISAISTKDKKENSFGSIALCSIGPILAVMVLSLFVKDNPIYESHEVIIDDPFLSTYISRLGDFCNSVLIALAPIAFFFFIFQLFFIKLPKNRLIKIFIGLLYTYIGLVLFLTTVDVCFMPIAKIIGSTLGDKHSNIVLVVLGFIMGLTVVLAEPAVHVLNKQVEELSGGTISKISMLLSLSLGVGISLALSMIRIIFNFSILFYLVPGYFLSILLSFFVPKIYTAIAFDSGGVASGPMTAGFILPFSIGVCSSLLGIENILNGAFGIVAMVAMTPLVTIQLLGFTAVMKQRIIEKRQRNIVVDDTENQIFYFD